MSPGETRYETLTLIAPGWNHLQTDLFTDTAHLLGVFHRENGRWPRRQNGDVQEKRLGLFLVKQRHRARRDIPQWRRDFLDREAPGWDHNL